MVLGWPAAPIAFTLIVLTACGASMNKLASEWPPNAATAAACAYILNPYALFVAYERTAYAELAAGIWLPLILLYAYRTASTSSSKPNESVILRERQSASRTDLRFSSTSIKPCHPERSAGGAQSKDLQFPSASTSAGAPGPASGTWVLLNKSTIPLALTIAAIWLTNAPAAVMACYTLATVTIWIAIRQKQWLPIFNSAAALSSDSASHPSTSSPPPTNAAGSTSPVPSALALESKTVFSSATPANPSTTRCSTPRR